MACRSSRKNVLAALLLFLSTGLAWAADPPPDPTLQPPSSQANGRPNPDRDWNRAVRLEDLLLSDIPRLVTAAAFREQTPEEAPSAVLVITADDIRASGARTLGEALQYYAGIDLIPGDRILVRGIGRVNRIGGLGDAGRILLLIDGVRINDVFSDSFTVGLARGVGDIARIEVIKGPGSALYGTSAFAGVVQVVTLRGSEEQGVQGRIRSEASAKHSAELRLAGSRGERDHALYLQTQVSGESWENPTWLGDLRASVDRRDATLEGGYSRIASLPPLSEGGTQDSSSESSPDSLPAASPLQQHAFLSLRGERNFTPKIYGFAQLSATGRSNSQPAHGFELQEARTTGEGRLRLRLHRKWWVTGGMEARREWARVILTEDLSTSSTRTSATRTSTTTLLSRRLSAGYVQTEVGPFWGLSLTTGLRVEQSIPSSDGVAGQAFQMVSPRVGLVANLPTQTILKAFYGQAFQAPSLSLLYYPSQVDAITILSNNALTPELLRSFEIEASQALGEKLRARVNLFQNDIDDLITSTFTDQQNVLQFANLYDARVRGVEGELSWHPRPRSQAFGNITLLDAYNKVNYHDLPLVASLRFNLGLSGALTPTTSGFLAVSYGGERRGTSGDPLSSYLLLEPVLRVDARVSLRIAPRWDLALSVRNLLGDRRQDFAETEFFTTPGTEAWLELSFRPSLESRSAPVRMEDRL